MIGALYDSTVEVIVKFAPGPPISRVCNLEDILSSNLYTHAILNLVYQTYEEIQHKYGSILNLTSDGIIAQLIRNGLAPQTARRCVDLIDNAVWQNQALPLCRWLESIRDVYYCPSSVRESFPSPTPPLVAPVARETPPLAPV
jgi:hypothetical protein